jgi:hypothetical protein
MHVDFMIIGAQKCGTSSLFSILDAHPLLVGSRLKEPHFFSLSNDWRAELSRYHQYFEQRDGALYFEASTTYSFYPHRNLHIWDDVLEYNPEMKFIYLVRNPVDRIVSSYMHTYERGYFDSDLKEAVIKERFLIDVTRYYTQISPYLRRFGREKILIIDFDDFIQKRGDVLKDIAGFLKIDFEGFCDYESVHHNVSIGGNKMHHKFDHPTLAMRLVRRYLPPLWRKVTDNSRRRFKQKIEPSLELREMIVNILELEVRELQAVMNKDLSKWMSMEI